MLPFAIPKQPSMMDAFGSGLGVDDAGFQFVLHTDSTATQALTAQHEATTDRDSWGDQNTVVLVKDEFGALFKTISWNSAGPLSTHFGRTCYLVTSFKPCILIGMTMDTELFSYPKSLSTAPCSGKATFSFPRASFRRKRVPNWHSQGE